MNAGGGGGGGGLILFRDAGRSDGWLHFSKETVHSEQLEAPVDS